MLEETTMGVKDEVWAIVENDTVYGEGEVGRLLRSDMDGQTLSLDDLQPMSKTSKRTKLLAQSIKQAADEEKTTR